jgi:hypothetical protein
VATIYSNLKGGLTSDNPLSSGATTINSSAFAALPTVTAPDILWLTLDPDAANGAPEIVRVTAHTASATSVTVSRGQQGTTQRSHPQNTKWAHAVTKTDLDEFLKSVGTANLIDGAVTSAKIADGTIATDDLADLAVTADKLAGNSVTSAKIVDGTIAAGDLASDSVTTAKILDANVTTAKIADLNVTTDKLAAGAVTRAKIANEAWTSHTPTINQPGSVSATRPYSYYTRVGRLVTWNFRLNVTGSGTAGHAALLSLPLAAIHADAVFGSGQIYDSSTGNRYAGQWSASTTTTIALVGDWSGPTGWGDSPSIGLAAGDVITGSVSYETGA